MGLLVFLEFDFYYNSTMKETPISKNASFKTAKKPRSVSSVPKIDAKIITLSQPTKEPAPTTTQQPIGTQSKDDYIRRISLLIKEAVSQILMRPLNDPFSEKPMKVKLDEVYLGSTNLYRLSSSNALSLWTEIELTLRITIQWRLEIISQYAESSYDVETCAIFVYGLRQACVSIEKDLKKISLALAPIDHVLTVRKMKSIYQVGMAMIEQELTKEPAYSCIRRSVAILFQGVRDGHRLTLESNILLSMTRKFAQDVFKSLRSYTIDVLRMYVLHVLIPQHEEDSLTDFLDHLVTQFENFSQFMKALRPANAANFVNLDRLILDFGLRYNLDAIWDATREIVYSSDDPPGSKLSQAVQNCLNVPDVFGGIPFFLEKEVLDLFGDSNDSRQGRNISSLIWDYITLWSVLYEFLKCQWWGIRSKLSVMIRVNWAKSIAKDPKFEETLIEGLAKYAHRELKRYKSVYDMEAGMTRHQIMQGFQALGGKDIFMLFYKRDLARRLLANMTLELDEEENRYVEAMTYECGSSFTQDIATMCADIDSSINLSYRFFDNQSPSSQGVLFFAKILTTGKWPDEPSKRTVPLPAAFSKYKQQFEEFYKTEHPNRKIKWAPSLDLLVIKASFLSGPRMLLVNLFQALIMLLFNDDPNNNGLTYSQIREALGFAKEDLNPALHSLVMGRVKLLSITATDRKRDHQRSSKIEDFSLNDRFHVLTDISAKGYQLKLHGYKVGGAYGNRKREAYDGLRGQLNRNRNVEIQAAIVRIMKRNQSMGHEMLFKLVQDATRRRGQITTSEFKQALEEVMASGNPYVGRDEKDPSSYVYL